jgi:RimJ/RimL family protein N-acetyltransferase
VLISGEKVQLRPVVPSDFPRIVTWGRDSEVTRFLDADYPMSLEECPAWLQEAESSRHTQLFAIVTQNGELIGDIELDHITWRSGDAELRIRIGERHLWDRGYGTDAVITLLDHAFSNMTLSRVYLRVFSANGRAVRCYEKAGFRKEGRLRRRARDGHEKEILLMRILRDEYLHQARVKQKARTA